MWIDPNGLLPHRQNNLRVVCLVPSLTELLLDFGLLDQVIARTKFCIHPKSVVKFIPKVGGTKNVNILELKSLQPDIVLANKEENTAEDIKQISEFAPVYVTDIQTLQDLDSFVREFSNIVPELKASEFLSQLDSIKMDGILKPATVAYLIWFKPLMTVGNDTFIHHVLSKVGWKNAFSDRTRYPEISWEELQNKKLDYLLLSSEPYPFKEKHVDLCQQKLPETKILLVDGEMFSWYGSRILKIVEYLQNLRKTVENI